MRIEVSVMRRFLIGLLAVLVFTGVSFAQPPGPLFSQPPTPLFKKGAVTITHGGRIAALSVEIADTPEARRRGLMHRASLPESEGMLFIYPASGPRSFWMKNTLIPLSVAFISSGWRITEIIRMNPVAGNADPPTYRSRKPARYALEVNQGWFKKNGVGVGARVRVE
jgi:hypothetical protein